MTYNGDVIVRRDLIDSLDGQPGQLVTSCGGGDQLFLVLFADVELVGAHRTGQQHHPEQRLAYPFQSVQAARQGYLLPSERSTAFTVSASAKSTARSASSVRRPSASDLSSRSRRCPG